MDFLDLGRHDACTLEDFELLHNSPASDGTKGAVSCARRSRDNDTQLSITVPSITIIRCHHVCITLISNSPCLLQQLYSCVHHSASHLSHIILCLAPHSEILRQTNVDPPLLPPTSARHHPIRRLFSHLQHALWNTFGKVALVPHLKFK